MADFNPGEVYDALNDDSQLRGRARQVDEMAKALVELCHTALMEMANLALDEGDEGFAADVAEHEATFVSKLVKTAVHAAVDRWKDARHETEILEGRP